MGKEYGKDMAAMKTHRITIPQRVSTLLSRRAKASNITFSKAILDIIEERDELLDDLEDRRISAICDERHRTSNGKYLTQEEVLAMVSK